MPDENCYLSYLVSWSEICVMALQLHHSCQLGHYVNGISVFSCNQISPFIPACIHSRAFTAHEERGCGERKSLLLISKYIALNILQTVGLRLIRNYDLQRKRVNACLAY